MLKLNEMNVIFTILIAIYIIRKISMYIRYKKSGKIVLQVKLQKDIFAVLIWVVVAGIIVVPTVKLYLSGNFVPPKRVEDAILWVCFIIIVAIVESQTPKITEGGIASSGKFWSWQDISSCSWENVEKDILSIDTINKLIVFKYPSVLRWRVMREQKVIISNLLKSKMK